MSHRNAGQQWRATRIAVATAICAAAMPAAAAAQSDGGLYIAGGGFTFEQAVGDALRKNTGGQRFFILAIPPETAAMTSRASRAAAAARDRAVAAGAVLYVCKRDIDKGAIDPANLVSGVIAVRGWPRVRSPELPLGARYFAGEDPSELPASNNALRKLRSTCAA